MTTNTEKKMTLEQRRKLIVQIVKSRNAFRAPKLTAAEFATARDVGLSMEPSPSDVTDELESLTGFRTCAKETVAEDAFYGIVEDASGDVEI